MILIVTLGKSETYKETIKEKSTILGIPIPGDDTRTSTRTVLQGYYEYRTVLLGYSYLGANLIDSVI